MVTSRFHTLRSVVQIFALWPAISNTLFVFFFTLPLYKCRHRTSNEPKPLRFKLFPVHHKAVTPLSTLGSLVTEGLSHIYATGWVCITVVVSNIKRLGTAWFRSFPSTYTRARACTHKTSSRRKAKWFFPFTLSCFVLSPTVLGLVCPDIIHIPPKAIICPFPNVISYITKALRNCFGLQTL